MLGIDDREKILGTKRNEDSISCAAFYDNIRVEESNNYPSKSIR